MGNPTDGVYFGLASSGPNNNSAWWEWNRADVGNWFNGTCGGELTFNICSNYTWAQRQAGSGGGTVFGVTDNGTRQIFGFSG